MPKTKIAVTLDASLLAEVDALVRNHRFSNRSQAIEAAVAEQLLRLRRTRLADACARLDSAEEHALAEEGFAADAAAWPEYRLCGSAAVRSAGQSQTPSAATSRAGAGPC